MIKTMEDDRIIMDKVEKEICNEFNVNSYALVDLDTSNNTSIARMFLFYILHHEYNFSYNKIASNYNRTIRSVFRNCAKNEVLLRQRCYSTIYEDILKRL